MSRMELNQASSYFYRSLSGDAQLLPPRRELLIPRSQAAVKRFTLRMPGAVSPPSWGALAEPRQDGPAVPGAGRRTTRPNRFSDRRSSVAGRSAPHGCGVVEAGEVNDEPRPLPFLPLLGDDATVGLDNPANEEEADARAALPLRSVAEE